MAVKNRRVMSLQLKKQWVGLFFTLPFILGFLVFLLWPAIQSIVFSLHTFSLTVDGYRLENFGLVNYKRAFLVDAQFVRQLLTAVGNMLINVPVTILFSFFAASVLNQKFHGRTVVRAIFFLPIIISASIILKLDQQDYLGSMIAAGTQIQNGMPTSGEQLSTAVVEALTRMNISPAFINFVVGTVNRVSEITIMSAVPIVIFLAGLQSVSPSLFEAAYIEGATGWEVFWEITFPMVSPLILVVVVFCTVDSFTNMTNVIIARVHATAFEQFDFGFSAAMAWSYTAVILAILGVVFLLLGKRVKYQ